MPSIRESLTGAAAIRYQEELQHFAPSLAKALVTCKACGVRMLPRDVPGHRTRCSQRRSR